MSNKNFWGFLIIVVLLFAFSSDVTALSEDFSIEVQRQQISACSCGLTAVSYTIRNTGSVTSTYQLSKSGSAAPYSTISESFFVLEPGASKEIINYINLPCSAIGELNEIIKVTTTFGLSKEFEQKIIANRCSNFEITPLNALQSSCPCSPVEYEINIKNTGSYDEIFDINVSKYAEYATLSESSIFLRPNENKNVVIYYNLPCEIYGEKELSVEIVAERAQYLAKVPLKLNIRNCYDYSITSNSQFSLCEGSALATPITIENNADFFNTFILKTSGKYAKIENNSITLAPNQSGATNLVVDASELKAGNYSFNILSTSERGELQKEIEASLSVEKCKDFVFKILEPEGKKISSESYDYQILIKNTGTRTGTFKIEVDGPEWMTLEKNSITLEQGEEGNVILKANIPQDFSGTAYAIVKVSEDSISYSKKISLNAIPIENAYLIELKAINKAVRYGFSDINVSIKNKGFEAAKYKLSLEGAEWMSLSQNEIDLAPGENSIIQIHTAPSNETPEGNYAAKIIATVAGTDIGYSANFNFKLFSAHWYEKLYNFLVSLVVANWLYILIVVVAIVIIILLVVLLKNIVKRMREKRKMKKELEATKIVEEPPLATYKPSFQPFITPTIIPEEPPKLRVPEIRAKREIDWAKFFRIFFLIIVAVGIIALVAINWGAISSYFSVVENQTENASLFAPELEINRSTGLEGEGNVVYLRENGILEIPVIIKNKAPAKVIYTINSVNASWIKADKDVLALDINESKTLNLLVNTTSVPDGTYEVSLDLNINAKDLKYSEKIELRIEREKPLWQKYIPYIAAGIGLAILLIIILSLTRKSRFDIKREKAEIKIERVKERKKHPGLFLKIILIFAIIAVIGGTYYYVSNLSYETEEHYDENLDFGSTQNQTILITLGANDKIIIPFIFSNNFEGVASYKIYLPAEWVEATDSSFSLSNGEVKYVNITAAPNSSVEEGLYEVAINVKVPSEGINFVKKVVLQKRNFSITRALTENKFLMIGIAIVIVGVLLLFIFKKKRAEKRQLVAEIRQEIEAERQKKATTSPAIKTKILRTKIGVKKSSRKKK